MYSVLNTSKVTNDLWTSLKIKITLKATLKCVIFKGIIYTKCQMIIDSCKCFSFYRFQYKLSLTNDLFNIV